MKTKKLWPKERAAKLYQEFLKIVEEKGIEPMTEDWDFEHQVIGDTSNSRYVRTELRKMVENREVELYEAGFRNSNPDGEGVFGTPNKYVRDELAAFAAGRLAPEDAFKWDEEDVGELEKKAA